MQAPSAPQNFKAIFFDLDGTLVDTEPAAAKIIVETFQEWGLTVNPDDARFITGRTWANAFEYFHQNYKIPLPRAEAEALLMKRYRDSLLREVVEVPGAREAVRSLAAEYPLALISGSSRQDIETALAALQIRHHFEFILGCEDYPRSKPDPISYQTALKKMNLEPHDVLVFEDSTAGIASGRAAGLYVVAVTSTNHFGQKHADAHTAISDLRGVTADWVRQISAARKTL